MLNAGLALAVRPFAGRRDAPQPGESSHRCRAVASMFGLEPHDPAGQHNACQRVELTLRPGAVVLITGASGGGKSALLRALETALTDTSARQIGFDARGGADGSLQRPLVDLVAPRAEDLGDVLRLLSLAGLNDARVMLRCHGALSEGQRHRLGLCLAMAEAEALAGQSCEEGDGLIVVLADEFGSTLDRTAAAAVARGVRKWVTRAGVCFIAASAHDDLLEPLAPDTLIFKPLGGPYEVHKRQRRDVFSGRGEAAHVQCHTPARAASPQTPNEKRWAGPWDALRLRLGRLADYQALAEHHYLAARPATATRVLVLENPRPTPSERFLGRAPAGQVAAVLVESLASLSCRLRNQALGDRYGPHLSAVERARLLNAEVRCISRVIVEPRWRGLGLAAGLVGHALASATTRYTEALAAMGRVHPFFEKAGMTAYARPPLPGDERLIAALQSVGFDARHLPCDDALAAALDAREPQRRAWLDAELRRWFASRRPRGPARRQHETRRDKMATASRSDPAPDRAACLAAVRQRLGRQPIYYVHGPHDV